MTDLAQRDPAASAPALALLACAVAIAGVAAVWAGASLILGGQCGFFAPLAALDAVLLLRLANWPAGPGRAALAGGVTLATIALGNYLLAAAHIGRAMGLRPVEAVGKMSLDLAWLHAQSNSGWAEGGWYLLALVLAWRLGR